jgi:hypothetical protein
LNCRNQNSSSDSTVLLEQVWFTPATLIEEIERRTGVRLKPETLSKWRTVGRGPKFLKIARNVIAYVYDDVEAWLKSLREAKNGNEAQGTPRTGRLLALPNRTEGASGIQRQHRFGRHHTKREGGAKDSERPAGANSGRHLEDIKADRIS